MRIEENDATRLHNAEHFQLHTEFKDLVAATGADNLNIAEQHARYLAAYADEDTAFKKIVKSAATEEVEAADRRRDATFRGLVTTVQGALHHFEPAQAEAARRLCIVLDTYGNLAAKPLHEETAELYNLLQELHGQWLPEVGALGLQGWVSKLQADNAAIDSLIKDRNTEGAAKTQLTVKEARRAVDAAYHAITERINALIVVEGEAPYADFVGKLNGFITTYENKVAQREGRAKAVTGDE
jgi:ribosomal protein L7/L12